MISAPDFSLTPFFAPQGVVVIGASTDPAKLGYGIAQNLVRGGYPGAIHFVNPKGGELFGRPLHQTITAVPDPVDLAVILVPPTAVPPPWKPAPNVVCARRSLPPAVLARPARRAPPWKQNVWSSPAPRACAWWGRTVSA